MTTTMTAVLLLTALCSTTGLAVVTSPSRMAAVRTSQPRIAQPAYMSAKPQKTKESVDVSQAAAGISAEMAEPPAKGSAAAAAASYRRSSDIMNNGDKVSARQVVNALGRWSSRREWNDAGIGRKALIDDYRNGDYYDDDVDKLKTDFNKPMQYYIARRPQFMDFCERYGLVARWVHRENVGKLPFPDDEAGRALAASVGATVAELNAEPVEELAADVVFDAMSQTGMVGFAEEEEVDKKRASFLSDDGSFNHDVFGASLARSRFHSAAALSGVRVIPPAIILGVMYHHLPQLLDMAAAAQAQVKLNWELHPASCFIPILPIGAFIYRWQTFTPAMERTGARTLNYQERAILERDQAYKEKMRLKKSGELDEEITPKLDEIFQDESYLQKMLSKGGGIRWGRPAQPEEPKRAPRRSSYEPSGLSDSGDEEVDEGLLWKMQIRPTKAKGPSYMMAQAGVGAWFFMLISVLMKASPYGL